MDLYRAGQRKWRKGGGHGGGVGEEGQGENEKSYMWRHTLESHGGVIGPHNGLNDYSMKVTGTFNDPLSRILNEAVKIKNLEDDPSIKCLNSKREYYQSQYIRTSYQKGTQNM